MWGSIWKFHDMCRENAVLVVGCSKAVSGLCFPEAKDCIFVDGPRNTTVTYVSEVAVLDTMFYHIQVSWEVRMRLEHPHVINAKPSIHSTASGYHGECSPNFLFISGMQPSYLGPAIISIECDLADAEGNTLGVPIKALHFQVLKHVAVRATAYKIGVHHVENM